MIKRHLLHTGEVQGRSLVRPSLPFKDVMDHLPRVCPKTWGTIGAPRFGTLAKNRSPRPAATIPTPIKRLGWSGITRHHLPETYRHLTPLLFLRAPRPARQLRLAAESAHDIGEKLRNIVVEIVVGKRLAEGDGAGGKHRAIFRRREDRSCRRGSGSRANRTGRDRDRGLPRPRLVVVAMPARRCDDQRVRRRSQRRDHSGRFRGRRQHHARARNRRGFRPQRPRRSRRPGDASHPASVETASRNSKPSEMKPTPVNFCGGRPRFFQSPLFWPVVAR